MPVDGEGDPRVGMARALGDLGEGDALGDQHGGMKMAQAMRLGPIEAEPRPKDLRRDPPEAKGPGVGFGR